MSDSSPHAVVAGVVSLLLLIPACSGLIHVGMEPRMELGAMLSSLEVEGMGLPLIGEAIPHGGSADNPTEQQGAETELSSREKQSATVTMGGDAAENAVSEGDPAEGSPFVLGEGLPTVLAKLVKISLKGDYVDMAELLQDNIEAARRQGDLPASSKGGTRCPCREVPDILSWLQCFGAYASITTHMQPGSWSCGPTRPS